MLVKKDKYFSYDELKKLVFDFKITNKNEYCKRYKELFNDGKKAPSNPQSFYSKLIWKGWSEFLGKPIFKKKHNNLYYPYEMCKSIIKNEKIKSKTDFYNKIKKLMSNDIGIPYNPSIVYKDKWEGWGLFLGTGRIQDNLKEYLPFESARDWARNLSLKMYKEWKFLDITKLPSNIPKKPDKTYKNKGWINWHDWLGIDYKEKISYGEKKIYDILKQNDIKFEYNKSLLDCKFESKLRFDFFLPEKNICIEYDGIQHYKPVDIFGGENEFEKNKIRDKIKDDFCKLNDIKLIRVAYYLKDSEIIDMIKKEVVN